MSLSDIRMFVLAGGLGTRLKPAVSDTPKVLAPIGEEPFLRLQLENWIYQGLRSFTFLLQYQSEKVINFLESERGGMLRDCEVDWIVEPSPLGTGGAVAHAIREKEMTSSFLLINADTWLGGGIEAVSDSAPPSIAVVEIDDTSRYGQVKFDDANRVVEFSEKVSKKEKGWINAGLCFLPSNFFKDWDGMPFSIEQTLFPLLVENSELTVVPLRTDFVDIGIPQDYSKFCEWIKSERLGGICN